MSLRELIKVKEGLSGEVLTKSKYHLPIIEAPDEVRAGELFRVKIRVGPHPNTPEHYIKRLDIYLSEDGREYNPLLIASVDLSHTYVEPDIGLSIKLFRDGKIHVVSYCTLHGLWEVTKEVKVKKS